MSDRREIKQMYSKSEGKMIVIPQEIRPTIGAYQNFKKPAFSVPSVKKRGDKSEREAT
ncbi:MAG: hypothetical protein IJP13_08575 [Lachnospiraceae bacterium]|nr:hypothetical protein [Lachnospiraceae bacterium]